MVKLTIVLSSRSMRHLQKKVFHRRGEYAVKTKNHSVRKILEEKNINVITADEILGISQTPKQWEIPDDLLPEFRNVGPRDTDRSVPAGEPIKNFVLSSRIKFTYGIKQACILTNTQSFKGLPPFVNLLQDQYTVKDQDMMVQKAIMQSQVWNSTREHLPTRKDPENIRWKFRKEYGIPDTKSAHILLDNFLLICGSLTKDFPKSLSRRFIYKPEVNTVFQYNEKNIHVNCMNTCMILSDRGLPLFADSSVIKKTMEYTLPSMDPVHPTIDLMAVTDLKHDGVDTGALTKPVLFPQTVFRVNGWAYCQPTTNQAFNLVNTYAIALAEAKQRFQQTSGELPYPICIQNVNITYNRLNFIYFQLNTLDTVNDNGIKNTAWFDSEKLFDKFLCQPWKHETNKYEPPKYGNFNPSAFKKFLVTYLYGIA